jgi:nucleoside diphosphate kinase
MFCSLAALSCKHVLLLLCYCSGRQVWEGKNIVLTGRKMIGATNPQASEPGTIRGDYAIEVSHSS